SNLVPQAGRALGARRDRAGLERRGSAAAELSYHTTRGEKIWGEPRGIAAGYQWPQISLHRGVLQMCLYDAVLDRIGADHVHLGHHLDSFESIDDGVTATFVDRGGRRSMVEGRLLVAADGIHSVARRQLYPDEGGPKWNGAVMWRG